MNLWLNEQLGHEEEHIVQSEDSADIQVPGIPPNNISLPTTPPRHTRSLRSRDNIKPPVTYSSPDWRSSTSRTNWTTGSVVDAETTSIPANIHINADTPQPSVTPIEETTRLVNTVVLGDQIDRPSTHPFTHQEAHALSVAIPPSPDPVTMDKAFKSAEAQLWKKAADEEYASLLKNQTWRLTLPPPGRNIITNKWIFKRKLAEDGTISRFKARLVVRGFSQRYGEDYTETFAPVVKFPTLRIVLALAAHQDLELQQLDVKTAYLNGYITKDIYMHQP